MNRYNRLLPLLNSKSPLLSPPPPPLLAPVRVREPPLDYSGGWATLRVFRPTSAHTLPSTVFLSPVVVFNESASRHHQRVWNIDQGVALGVVLYIVFNLKGKQSRVASVAPATSNPSSQLPSCLAASTSHSAPGPRTAASCPLSSQ